MSEKMIKEHRTQIENEVALNRCGDLLDEMRDEIFDEISNEK